MSFVQMRLRVTDVDEREETAAYREEAIELREMLAQIDQLLYSQAPGGG
jgi:hypothetical protein